MIPDEEKLFYKTENVENRPVVNKLASAIGQRMATFFYTHTCSMKDHIVMKHLKAYLDSDDALCDLLKCINFDISNNHEKAILQDSLISSACTIVLRAWDNICNIWLHYICESNEKPAGTVDWFFHRKELQEKLPMYIILTLFYGARKMMAL